MDTVREPAWAWILAGLMTGILLRELRAPPAPVLTAAERARWGPDADPRRMSPRELRRIPGVGEWRALAAARERWGHDPVKGVLRWSDVPGIGPGTEQKAALWLAERGVSDSSLVLREVSAKRAACPDEP